MWSKRAIVGRAVLVVAAVAVVAVFSGCSSVEPTDTWSDDAGRVAGTVVSDGGAPLSGIEVWLWAELGMEAREVCYQTQTDQQGAYEFPTVEMATRQSFEATYWIAVNRDAERSTPINESYTSWLGMILVPSGGTWESEVVIDWVDDGPDEPETYVEG